MTFFNSLPHLYFLAFSDPFLPFVLLSLLCPFLSNSLLPSLPFFHSFIQYSILMTVKCLQTFTERNVHVLFNLGNSLEIVNFEGFGHYWKLNSQQISNGFPSFWTLWDFSQCFTVIQLY